MNAESGAQQQQQQYQATIRPRLCPSLVLVPGCVGQTMIAGRLVESIRPSGTRLEIALCTLPIAVNWNRCYRPLDLLSLHRPQWLMRLTLLTDRQTDRQTDGRTDGRNKRTSRQTDK